MKKTAIMGFGNPVRSDDGIGCYVIAELNKILSEDPNLTILDMGTSAFEVLFQLQGHTQIIVVDAVINTGEPIGTLYKLPAEAVEAAIIDDPMVFLHSLKWDQALSYAKRIMRETYPKDIEVYLIAVDNTRLDVSLSDEVKAAGDKVVGLIQKALAPVPTTLPPRGSDYFPLPLEKDTVKKNAPTTEETQAAPVKLKAHHLHISADLAKAAFDDVAQVYTVYYPQKNSLLLAPMTDEFFPKLHKAHLQMLKTRNLQGDKTIYLREILIDNDLDDSDRDLSYNYTEGGNLLNVIMT